MKPEDLNAIGQRYLMDQIDDLLKKHNFSNMNEIIDLCTLLLDTQQSINELKQEAEAHLWTDDIPDAV